MIRRRGLIEAKDDKTATVKLTVACNACSESGCAMSWRGRHSTRVKVASNPYWQVGEFIDVTIAPSRLLWLAWVGYGWPLLGCWTGLIIGAQFGDWSTAALGMAGLLVALVLGRRHDVGNELRAATALKGER